MNDKITTALKPTGVPVSFQFYGGDESTYITFFEYNQMGVVFAEDSEERTRRSIQVDVWSKGNYKALVAQVKELLSAKGFVRNSENEFYERETRTFHKALRFYYERIGGN